MRVPLAMLALTISVPAAASDVTISHGNPMSASHRVCRPTRPYVAGASSIYHGQRLTPRELTDLPPGNAYFAVYRHIGGCEAPLKMVGYRSDQQH